VRSYSHGVPITEEIFRICAALCDPDSDESLRFWWNKDLLNGDWVLPWDPPSTDPPEYFELDFNDSPPRAKIPFNWYVKHIDIEFSNDPGVSLEEIEKYVSFYFEGTESSISNFLVTKLSPKDDHFVFRFKFRYYFGGPFQFLGDFWEKVNILSVTARFALGNDKNVDPILNVDTYKIDSSQSSVSYDRQGNILVFYSNEETGNIDVAISYDDGDSWVYDRNLIRLISGEYATLPFAIKDSNSGLVHLFYVLNDKFVMYRKVDTDMIDSDNSLVTYPIPLSYRAGDYNLTLEDPEKDYWGEYTTDGVKLRREPSYFVIGSSEDEYFLEQLSIITELNNFNQSLQGTPNAKKIQTNRFLFAGLITEMRDDYKGSPYAAYLADDGSFRVFFVSSNRLSIKSSKNYITWTYDVFEQSIHKNYMKDELNKGFSEDISNVQIVRDDFDKSVVSVLYFHNGMLFIRHFQTNLLFAWYDSKGILQDQQMIRHLEIVDEDLTIDPPIDRTKNLPIFLVGVIPEKIRNSIKEDIDNEILIKDSDLAIYFPYKDPEDHTGLSDSKIKDLNKKMVDIFDVDTVVLLEVIDKNGDWVSKLVETDFSFDNNTQAYAYTSTTGLIRVFYKDNFGNINGIIIDALMMPNLEVMNIFNGIEIDRI